MLPQDSLYTPPSTHWEAWNQVIPRDLSSDNFRQWWWQHTCSPCLLCARGFACCILFHPHNHPMRQTLWILPDKGGNRDSESLGPLPKGLQLIGGQVWLRTQGAVEVFTKFYIHDSHLSMNFKHFRWEKPITLPQIFPNYGWNQKASPA